jgi:hypothetical protein
MRRASVLVLWTVAVAFVFASAGSSGIAGPSPPPPAADLNSLLYPGTVRPDLTCANPRSCTHADVTFTNPQKFAINSWMVEIKGNPFKSVKLDGEPPCTSTGGKFGPDFDTSWLCLGFKVEPGETITGSLIATKPLTPTTSVRFDWSNKGSQGGLLPDYSHDIPYYWLPETPAEQAVGLITEAIDEENDAIKNLDEIQPKTNGATEANLRKSATEDLDISMSALGKARAALESVSEPLHSAVLLDMLASYQLNHGNHPVVKHIQDALGDKQTALAIAQKAAAKK